MHKVMCLIAVILYSFLLSKIEAQNSNSNYLTIEIAVSNAIEYNPELQTLLKNIDASKAIKLQSGLIPNPEFGIDAENIFGSGDYSGFKGSEITAFLSQDISLARKISKLENVAGMDVSIAEWDYESKRLEIITNIRSAFTRALATQKLIEKNNELIETSNELIMNLKARVKAGKISPAEVSRSQIILNSLQIEINRLKADYDSDIFELMTLINNPNLLFESLNGELKYIDKLPDYDSLYVKLENNPNLKRFESEYNKQKAVISYEKSKATPDLTISAGYRRLIEVNVNTFVLGASMPLPIFDRNQGSIQEAHIRLDQKTKEFETIKNRFTLRLNLLYKRFGTLLITFEKLKNESIPDAEEAFKIIKEGNLVGRFTILDVLDAQRTLFEIENQYLNTLGSINAIVVEIEGLTVNNIN
ncbi:MAG: TolC family protein [Melioribacteraceae bacterium]|nr:TolC family protein [Melioribacteraceae bacterium]